MRHFKYQDLDGTHYLTEEDILAQYYPHWQQQMTKVGKADQISPEGCIEDFVAVHWAEEVTEGRIEP